MDIYSRLNLGQDELGIGSVHKQSECAVVVLSEEDGEDLYSLYSNLYEIIQQYKKVVLINTNKEQLWSRLIYSLMLDAGQYNIYETDKDNVDSEYLSFVEGYENHLVDIKNYLGNSLDEPMSLVAYLNKIVEAMGNQDIKALIGTVQSVRTLGKKSVEFIQFIESFNKDLIKQLNLRDTEIHHNKQMVEELKVEVQERLEEINKVSGLINEKDNELFNLRKQIEEKASEMERVNGLLVEGQAKLETILQGQENGLDEVKQLMEEVRQLTGELEEKDRALKEIKELLEGKEEELRSLQANSERIQELSELVENYKVRLEELKVQEEETESLRQLLNDKEGEIDRLSSDLEKYESLNVDLDNLRNENEQYKLKIEEMTSEISELKEKLEETDSKVGEVVEGSLTVEEVEKLQEDNKQLLSKCARYKVDIASLKASNDSFLDKLRNKAAGAMEFNPLLLNNNPKIKSRNILYFKEVSYVTYTNTMLVKTLDLLLKKKQRVKMVIFDKPDEFSPCYQGLTIVNGDYGRKKEDVLQKDIVVIMEPNMAILEDILSEQYTLVLIVDRLKCVKDLVIGNQVYKFWMVNSSSGIQAIMQMGSISQDISSSSIITRPGVGHDTIGISKITDYPTFTEQAKSSKWYHLTNVNAKNTDSSNALVIASILGRCGINIRGKR